MGPSKRMDHASRLPHYAPRWELTPAKWKAEGFMGPGGRDKMSDEVKQRVDQLWKKAGLTLEVSVPGEFVTGGTNFPHVFLDLPEVNTAVGCDCDGWIQIHFAVLSPLGITQRCLSVPRCRASRRADLWEAWRGRLACGIRSTLLVKAPHTQIYRS